jgi:hypothetical protein
VDVQVQAGFFCFFVAFQFQVPVSVSVELAELAMDGAWLHVSCIIRQGKRQMGVRTRSGPFPFVFFAAVADIVNIY